MRNFRAQTKIYWKIINVIFIYLLALLADPEDAQFLVLKKKKKTCNEPCSFHSCLSTCQKSLPDITILVRYLLVKYLTVFGHFCQGRTDGPYFIGPCRPRPAVQKTK